jgi:hypothetical protein
MTGYDLLMEVKVHHSFLLKKEDFQAFLPLDFLIAARYFSP